MTSNIDIKGKIYAYDINLPLIYTYKNIKKKVDDVINNLKNLKKEYDEINGDIVNRKPANIMEAKTSKESYYYYIRKSFNDMTTKEKKTPKASAMFIFLNKTCFRGLFREGKNGINVPFGNNKNVGIYSEEHLREISKLIKNVHFKHKSYDEVLIEQFKKGDFIYMDPPYFPENENSFVGYNKQGFNKEQHDLLFELSEKLYENNINFVMSNSAVDYVKKKFDDNKKYSIKILECKRNINSKKPNAKTNEVIISTKIE